MNESDECSVFQNESNDTIVLPTTTSSNQLDISISLPSSHSIEISSNTDSDQSLSNASSTTDNAYETAIETIQPIHQRTIQEIMVESDTSLNSSSDGQTESNTSLEPNINTSTVSDDAESATHLEYELAHMKAKSKDIEEIIEKLLLKS